MKINVLFLLILLFSTKCFSQGEFSLGSKANEGGAKDKVIPLDGNGVLGNTYDVTKCGLNFVQTSVKITNRNPSGGAGTGMPTMFTITGLPASCRMIEQAYLWYELSYFVGSPATPTVTVTNPASNSYNYTSSLIGSGPGKCWSELGTWSFRIDVTNAISGNGNYSVNIETNPGGPYPNGDEIDGATLLIVYSDVNAPYEGSLILNDGIITKVNNNGSNATLSGLNVCANSSFATGFAISGDYQVLAVAANHSVTINGAGQLFPSDFWNFDQMTTAVTAGQTNSSFGTYPLGTDCHSLVVVGLYYQTTTCTTCPFPLSTSATVTPATCNQSNGTATAIPSTGLYAPYSYAWSPGGQTTATATGLAPGTYTITISDASGCKTSTGIATISPSSGLSSITTTPTNVSCNGGNNGSASAVPAGGNAPYTYTWSNGQSSSAAIGLSAGTYTVVVKDMNGCSNSSAVTITQPAAITITTTVTQANCGVSNGSATAGASGGNPSYTYLWSNGQAAATATGLLAGLYTVTVSDGSGCTKTKVVSVSNANGPNTILSQVDVPCNGQCTGSASATVSGGAAPYTYQWSNAQSSSAVSNLCAGNYTMVVTDASGCTDPQSVVITEPLLLSTSLSATPESCGQSNGVASVSASGGSGPYSYTWSTSPIQNTASATGLAAGTYTVVVADANGCTAVDTVSVPNQTGISSSITKTNVLCSGQCNGNASAAVSGGSLPYTYQWSNFQVTSTAGNLCPGTYTLTVSDASGCSVVQTVIITQPTVISVSATTTPASCTASDGTATATASGGTGALTYSWNTSPVQTTPMATGLSAVGYVLSVTDSNGCVLQSAVTVQSLNPVTSSIAQTDVLCNGGTTGSATVTVNGGSNPYSYNWTGGQVISTANGLSAGLYVCLITDANGCTSTQTVVINEPAALLPGIASTNANCGKADGTANASASGGVAPYTYTWSNAQTGASATGLVAGTYTVFIVDVNGCSQTTTALVGTNPGPVANAGADVTITLGANANLSASGGSAYSWTPSSGLSCDSCENPIASPTQTTQYCVTVTDENGCTDTDCITVVVEPPCPDNADITLPTAFTPNGDGHNDLYLIVGLNNCVVKYTLVIYNRWGEKVFESSDPHDSWNGTFHGKSLDAAVFVYYFSAVFSNNQNMSIKGNISLIK